MSAGGKGSAPRPLAVPLEQFGSSFEAIFGVRPRPNWERAPACDCAAGQCKAADARGCADWAKREGNAK